MSATRFLSPAENEMLEAAAYYESRAKGLSRDFLRKVHNAVTDIEAHSYRWPVVEFGVQRASSEVKRSLVLTATS